MKETSAWVIGLAVMCFIITRPIVIDTVVESLLLWGDIFSAATSCSCHHH